MLFTKMHGLGNNYIFFNLLESTLKEAELSSLAIAVSDVQFGIGSDGMILICPSEVADFRMRIFNKDGSEGKNCGNGLRCVAKYVYDQELVKSTSFTIETLGGIVNIYVTPDEKNKVDGITVDMGEPKLSKGSLPMKGDSELVTINEPFYIGGNKYHLTCVSMGNPHAILFVDDVDQFPLEEIGPLIEHSDLFPERVNFGIVSVNNSDEINYRVWERGSGVTMACGTGACAAVVAAVLNGKVEKDQSVRVHLPGGSLEICWGKNNHIRKNGPAEYSCRGDLDVESLLARISFTS